MTAVTIRSDLRTQEEELKSLLRRVKDESERASLKLNIKKKKKNN